MAIVVLTSAGGSPGVTTLAVGLTLTWPRAVLLADADPGAHQSVLAGFLAGRSSQGKGLLRIAEAYRDRRSLREVVMDQTLALTDDEGPSRLFLPGFTTPGAAGLFTGIWPDLVETFDRLGDVDIDVIVDAGRLGERGLPPALLDRAAVTALVTRSSLRSVMSAKVHLQQLRDGLRAAGSEAGLGLCVVGGGAPYSANEIGRALALPVLASIADDQRSAEHLSDGVTRHRKFETAPLARSLHTASAALSERLENLRDQLAHEEDSLAGQLTRPRTGVAAGVSS